MEVEGEVQAFVVDVFQKALGVGYEVSIPSPSRPGSAPGAIGFAAVPVPVNVEYHHVDVDVVLVELAYHSAIIFGRVGGELAVPVP